MSLLRSALKLSSRLHTYSACLVDARFYEQPKGFQSEHDQKKKAESLEKAVTKISHVFDEAVLDGKSKNREAFEHAIGLFLQRSVRRKGHVEFIYAALKRLQEYNVHKDLEVYKNLLNVFPKGKMVPRNRLQAEYFHFARQQDCCIWLLDEMCHHDFVLRSVAPVSTPDPGRFLPIRTEDIQKHALWVPTDDKYVLKNPLKSTKLVIPLKYRCVMVYILSSLGVHPDKELYDIVVHTFGEWSQAMRKMKRIMYWIPKFKNLNPVPYRLPDDSFQVAKFAVNRMCRDPATDISVWFTDALEEYPDRIWIVSGQAPDQKELIAKYKGSKALYIEGPFQVWARDKQIFYFVFMAENEGTKVFTEYSPSPYDVDTKPEDWAEKWETKYNRERPSARRELMKAPNFHEQPEGTILAIGATQTSTKDSLLAWLMFLQRDNPRLASLPVVFKLKHEPTPQLGNTDEADSAPRSAELLN